MSVLRTAAVGGHLPFALNSWVGVGLQLCMISQGQLPYMQCLLVQSERMHLLQSQTGFVTIAGYGNNNSLTAS